MTELYTLLHLYQFHLFHLLHLYVFTSFSQLCCIYPILLLHLYLFTPFSYYTYTYLPHSLNYPILSVLPDKFARFLFEIHSHRFESLDLPQLPADRSDFDVHGALLDDKVQTNCNTLRFAQSYPLLCLNNFLYVL